MKRFKYDVIQLIEGVRDKPCLWDRSLEIYKDRIERRNAWEEIFHNLEPKYEEMSWEQKRTTGELILNKWTNIRDTFIKTLKSKMGKPKRKYLFYDHLKFLTKVVPEEECTAVLSDEPSYSYMKQETDSEEQDNTSYGTKRKKKDDDYTPKKSKREKEVPVTSNNFEDADYDDTYDNTDQIDFVEVESDPRLMNEDEAFFASLLPSIVKYSEDERLEFRMEVLAVMKRIKDKRN